MLRAPEAVVNHRLQPSAYLVHLATVRSTFMALDARLTNLVRRDTFLTNRRLAIAGTVFALFVVFDIGLFGWLILESLSQREIEKVLLETREEAEPLARELATQAAQHDGDLFVVLSIAQETRSYLEDMLTKRDIVQKIEIRDHNGTVVYGPVYSHEEVPLEIPAIPRMKTGEGKGERTPLGPTTPGLQADIPIGDLGTLVIGLEEREVQRRIGVLRQDLIRQSTLIGVLTLALLVVAFMAVWKLFHRARSLEEQALEAERLAYVGTLASGLAHEIRNPLNSLNLNMQMLEEEVSEQGGSQSQKRLLSITRSELGRLERLATDFLSYARPRSIELEEIEAGELLERTVHVLEGEIHDLGAEVRVEDGTNGARVRVDEALMGQLLLNLTKNALTANEEPEKTPKVRLGARREGHNIVLEVRDNGPGIPKEERQRIFDLFYSTRKGGTGLGLAIVQRIAEAHGTEMEVDGHPGSGAILRLRLPMIGAQETASGS
jgi:signal transduction histidine kinase